MKSLVLIASTVISLQSFATALPEGPQVCKNKKGKMIKATVLPQVITFHLDEDGEIRRSYRIEAPVRLSGAEVRAEDQFGNWAIISYKYGKLSSMDAVIQNGIELISIKVECSEN